MVPGLENPAWGFARHAPGAAAHRRWARKSTMPGSSEPQSHNAGLGSFRTIQIGLLIFFVFFFAFAFADHFRLFSFFLGFGCFFFNFQTRW